MNKQAVASPGELRERGLRPVTAAGLRLLHRYSFAFALLLAIVLLIINLIRTPNFGWTQQLASLAPLAVAAMATTPAIIAGRGGLDLSISPLMIMTSALYITWLDPAGWGGGVAVPVLLLIGIGVGLANGLMIILLRIPAVIVTLGMYFALIGVNLKLAPTPVSVSSTWLRELAGTVGPIPGPLFLIGFPILVWMLIGLIPYRGLLYAIGGNDTTAFSSGVNVAAVRVLAYALGGMFAAVGGMAILAISGSASAALSPIYTLQAIAAVALGGTSLWGGRGGIIGSLCGATSLYLLGTLLIGIQVSPSWLQVISGGMLLLAVVLVSTAAKARSAA